MSRNGNVAASFPVNEGDEVLAKCIDIDPSGRIRLSRKEALEDASTDG